MVDRHSSVIAVKAGGCHVGDVSEYLLLSKGRIDFFALVPSKIVNTETIDHHHKIFVVAAAEDNFVPMEPRQ